MKLARKNDLFVISDEVYDEIIFDGKHVSALPYDTDGRVVGAFSFSKTYAMTGFRLGYAIAAKEIITNMTKLQEGYVSCPTGISQKAAEAALKGSQDCVGKMVEVYHENVKAAISLLDNYKISYLKPKGAFYLWVNVNCEDSTEFTKRFLIEQRVAVAPGNTFGPGGKSYIRISLASSKKSIEKGIHRLAVFIDG